MIHPDYVQYSNYINSKAAMQLNTSANLKVLTKLNARKAKHGFRLDGIRPSYFIALGRMMEALADFAEADFSTEMVGMHHNDFRLYTDNDEIADMINANFCAQ